MGRLRAIRVGMLLCGVLACAGCQTWKGGPNAANSGRYINEPVQYFAPDPAFPLPAEVIAESKAKEEDDVQKNWRRPWFTDQSSHLTPERIQGGIY